MITASGVSRAKLFVIVNATEFVTNGHFATCPLHNDHFATDTSHSHFAPGQFADKHFAPGHFAHNHIAVKNQRKIEYLNVKSLFYYILLEN